MGVKVQSGPLGRSFWLRYPPPPTTSPPNFQFAICSGVCIFSGITQVFFISQDVLKLPDEVLTLKNEYFRRKLRNDKKAKNSG